MSATLDRETLEAVGVLARAVDQAQVPGVLEFRMLTGALNKAMDSRREDDLRVAAAIFEALDSGFRAQIIERAWTEAESFVRAHAHPELMLQKTGLPPASTLPTNARQKADPGPAAPSVPKPAALPRVQPRAATSFLAALNGGRRPQPSATPPLNGEPPIGEPPIVAEPVPGGEDQISLSRHDRGLDPSASAEDSRSAAKARLQAEVTAARARRPGQVPRAASFRRQGKDE